MTQQLHWPRLAVRMRRWLCAATILLPALVFVAAQDGSAGAPAGRVFVPETVMDGYCVTRVTPDYPSGLPALTAPTVVVLRVMIRKSGTVTPLYRVSGPHELEAAAMDAVRLWRYSPYFRDRQPVDVVTETRVEFDPGSPGGLTTHPAR